MAALNSIAVIRAQKGMTPGQLAQVTRIGRPLLKAYEAGTKAPPDHHALRIAMALQVDYLAIAKPINNPPPVPYVPVVSSDPLQAEIDRLNYDLRQLENKDRYDAADVDELRRINAALNAAYERMRDRDAVEWKVAAE